MCGRQERRLSSKLVLKIKNAERNFQIVLGCIHEKYIWNLIKSNLNQIVCTIFFD